MEGEEAEASKRKVLIIGNWKCHGDLSYVKEMVNNMLNKITFDPSLVEAFTAPPMIHIPAVKAMLTSKIGIVAQNVTSAKISVTGEVNAENLKDFGIEWVIVGSSERRELFQDTDEVIASKIENAQKAGLNVVLCLVDRVEEKDPTKAWQVIEKQLVFFNEKKIDWKKTVIAYEPITGPGAKKAISIEQVEETCEQIRKWIQEVVAPQLSEEIRILYSGTVAESNCKVYMMQKNVDGFLLGKESLTNAFASLIKICNEARAAPAQHSH